VSTRNDSDGATGNISLNVSSLKLDGGAYISASTTGGVGAGGKLTIEASESVSLMGDSRIESGSRSGGAGGSILINTRDLSAEDSFIDSSSTGYGSAGDIKITAASLRFKDSTVKTSALKSAGGNIVISVSDMLMLQNSSVSASANSVTPLHNGGNVTIGTPQFFILNRSDILARANAGTSSFQPITS
jgi:large exoprotein involved in heme utilization and adhesion